MAWVIPYLAGHIFFDSRTQCVTIDNYTFEVKSIASGVIQWSVFGPFLFAIYVDDIFDRFVHSKAFIFADDLNMSSLLNKP